MERCKPGFPIWAVSIKPGFPIWAVFRLNGQPKRDDGMIFARMASSLYDEGQVDARTASGQHFFTTQDRGA